MASGCYGKLFPTQLMASSLYYDLLFLPKLSVFAMSGSGPHPESESAWSDRAYQPSGLGLKRGCSFGTVRGL